MRALWCWMVCIALMGCDVVPRDAGGALDRVRGDGALHVGVAERSPWIAFHGGRVTGVEAELLEAWARELGARVVWHRGAPADLVEALHRRELDVLAAGLDARTPYASRLALTQPYLETMDRRGQRHEHVLAVTQGESALLLSLDRFLASQDAAALRPRARP